MNPNLRAQLNSAINQNLQGLGNATAKNFATLERAFGSQPAKWGPQLGADLEKAITDYQALLLEAIEEQQAPNMSKVTKALERIAVVTLCLRIITAGTTAPPRIVVASH